MLQILAGILVGAGLGAWLAFEAGDEGARRLLFCVSGGATAGLTASFVLVLKDLASEKPHQTDRSISRGSGQRKDSGRN